jgi:DNA repair photolyase
MVAPVIPGLTDSDLPQVLERAAAAGARNAGYVFLRLPLSVRPVFEERVRQQVPLRAEKILARTREARGGKMYDSRWGIRQRGEGEYAAVIERIFEQTTRRVGLTSGCSNRWDEDAPSTFRRPTDRHGQMRLFGE